MILYLTRSLPLTLSVDVHAVISEAFIRRFGEAASFPQKMASFLPVPAGRFREASGAAAEREKKCIAAAGEFLDLDTFEQNTSYLCDGQVVRHSACLECKCRGSGLVGFFYFSRSI